jgi:hypothetical protein
MSLLPSREVQEVINGKNLYAYAPANYKVEIYCSEMVLLWAIRIMLDHLGGIAFRLCLQSLCCRKKHITLRKGKVLMEETSNARYHQAFTFSLFKSFTLATLTKGDSFQTQSKKSIVLLLKEALLTM